MNNCIKSLRDLINKIIVLIVLFSIPLCSQAVSNTKITKVRVFETVDGTRIIFNFSTIKQVHIFSLEKPPRLVFDFDNTQLDVRLNKLNLLSTNITSIREGYPHPKMLRIVIDAKMPFSFKKISQLNPYQMVVDIYSVKNFPERTEKVSFTEADKIANTHKVALDNVTPVKISLAKGAESKLMGEKVTSDKALPLKATLGKAALVKITPDKTAQVKAMLGQATSSNSVHDKATSNNAIQDYPIPNTEETSRSQRTNIAPLGQALLPVKKRPFIVVVDAGHGGKDTGAIGFYKTREKDIVLAIAIQLAKLINQQPNMRAIMTRKGDYFVPLANRLILTRKDDADLFIAIHADSYFNTRANGASVFALSQRGATTVAAKWLSDSDNHSELDGVELNQLNDKSPMLRSVLIDLAQTITIRDSLHFGNSILDSLENITKLHASHVEQAPFMVLKSPDIPSILVETGFISNGTEELRLRDPTYQHKLALALFNGIRLYQKKYNLIR